MIFDIFYVIFNMLKTKFRSILIYLDYIKEG